LLDKSSQSSDEEFEGFEQVEEVLGLDIESDVDDADDDDDDDIQAHEVFISIYSFQVSACVLFHCLLSHFYMVF
jgi:hypothetical protein